jgi:hypothetical protein
MGKMGWPFHGKGDKNHPTTPELKAVFALSILQRRKPSQGNRILASKDFTNSRRESWKHPGLLDVHLSRQLQYRGHLG